MQSRIRKAWIIVFLVLTGGALGMELWAGLDTSPTTVPWTELISEYIPQPITMTVLATLAAWLPAHFRHHYTGQQPPPDRYSKTIVAAVVAGVTALGLALTDDTVTRGEMTVILLEILGAAGVYQAPNAKRPPEVLALLRGQQERDRAARQAGRQAEESRWGGGQQEVRTTSIPPSLRRPPSAPPPASGGTRQGDDPDS